MMRTNCITDEMKKAYHKKWSVLDGFGYGFGVRCEPDLSYGIMASPSEFGWHGAAGSYMIIDPETKTSLFYAQHMLNNKERYVHPRIRHTFYSAF
jgi:CubicO group peptidase (beta-lactamase class C family)